MLEFTFWDVQHGSACYINTPNRRHIVVDLGTGSYGANRTFSPLLHLKENLGIGQLDYVVITHPHRDHLDDIFNFDKLNPKALNRPKHLSKTEIVAGNKNDDSEIIEEYLQISSRYTQPISTGSSQDILSADQWGGVRMSLFSTPSCNTNNLNNHSIVSVFHYANSTIVIPGDNEPESWRQLLRNQAFITAAKGVDVFVAPHHGRRSAYCPELFEAIGKPSITVISDGPECDTSATQSYGSQSRGWRVYYADDTFEQRHCVTTRCDGVIMVRAYYFDNMPRLNVHVEKGTANPN